MGRLRVTLHASARANRGSLPRTSPASHPHDEFSAPVRTRNRADWVWGGEKKKKKKIIICRLQEKKTLRFLFLFDQYFPVYGLAAPDACLYQRREAVCGRRAGYFSLRVLAALASPAQPALLGHVGAGQLDPWPRPCSSPPTRAPTQVLAEAFFILFCFV